MRGNIFKTYYGVFWRNVIKQICIVLSETSEFWKFNYTFVLTVTPSLLQIYETEKLTPMHPHICLSPTVSNNIFCGDFTGSLQSYIPLGFVCWTDTLMSLAVAHSKGLQASEWNLLHIQGFNCSLLSGPSSIALVLCQNCGPGTGFAKGWLRHLLKPWKNVAYTKTLEIWHVWSSYIINSDPHSCT